MTRKVVVRSTKPAGWSRSTSIDSNSGSISSSTTSSSSAIPSPPSSELCALIGFAYRLGSVVHNNDPNTDSNNSDVRREAKLLMSLSCSSPVQMDDEKVGDNSNCNDSKARHGETMTMSTTWDYLSSPSSSTLSTSTSTGRITPTHSITSISSGGSRRDTFCFTCPSLSLDNAKGTAGDASPGSMLSRTLKVDDKDAMRLSSEAMARNIIESFQKAIEWRIQSWVDSLSRVLVIKEMELKIINEYVGSVKGMQLQQELFFSNEALLVKTLREIEGKVQVVEAKTAFKVLNKVSQVDETGSALKKRRMGEQEDRTGLEEGEYVYDVTHVLEMQCSLNISTPAGNVRIDLNVPGKIIGTFFSSEDESCDDNLTSVTIDLNTEMMASMIEKSSRIAVRTSSEAYLGGDHTLNTTNVGIVKKATHVGAVPQEQDNAVLKPPKASITAPSNPTRSPKRKVADSNVSGLVVITPSRYTASSPSSFGESSDSDVDNNKPVRLQIPSNFPSTKIQQSGNIVQPQPSRARSDLSKKTRAPGTHLDFAARLPPKKYMLQQKKKSSAVVTPLRRNTEYIKREKGPNLPVLVEAACAAIHSKK